jgi:hypothetical protein
MTGYDEAELVLEALSIVVDEPHDAVWLLAIIPLLDDVARLVDVVRLLMLDVVKAPRAVEEAEIPDRVEADSVHEVV